MKRFTYLTPTWDVLAIATDLGAMRLERLAESAGVSPIILSEWRQDLVNLPVWFVVLAHLHADAPHFPDAVDLVDFIRVRAIMKTPTLARLIGVNPQTVQRWLKPSGGNRTPDYLPLLLGLLSSSQGLIRARRVVADLISADAERPGVAYPFRIAA